MKGVDLFDLPEASPADQELLQKEEGKPPSPAPPPQDERPGPTSGRGSFGPKPSGGSSAPSF